MKVPKIAQCNHASELKLKDVKNLAAKMGLDNEFYNSLNNLKSCEKTDDTDNVDLHNEDLF